MPEDVSGISNILAREALPDEEMGLSFDLIDRPWYSNEEKWRYRFWGVRSDVWGLSLDVDEGFVQATFQSAFFPSDVWLRAMRKKYPLLEFSLFYHEPANKLAGYM